jgi:hypothetical protein
LIDVGGEFADEDLQMVFVSDVFTRIGVDKTIMADLVSACACPSVGLCGLD